MPTSILHVHQHLQTSSPHILALSETQTNPTSNTTHLLCSGNEIHTKFRFKKGLWFTHNTIYLANYNESSKQTMITKQTTPNSAFLEILIAGNDGAFVFTLVEKKIICSHWWNITHFTFQNEAKSSF